MYTNENYEPEVHERYCNTATYENTSQNKEIYKI